jgi:hypothetical protein
MKTKILRHAQRRIKLYRLNEADIIAAAVGHYADLGKSQGKVMFLSKLTANSLPVKIVYSVEHETLVLITAYPFKRSMQG